MASHGKLITVTRLEDIHFRCPGDKHSYSVIATEIVNKKLIVADEVNTNLKLIDTTTNRLLDTLALLGNPLDVAPMNNHQVIVLIPLVMKIVIVNVTDKLTIERAITVRGGWCQGVASSHDRLLVTFKDTPRLEMLDLLGNVIRTIEDNSDGSKMFKSPRYVCTSKDGDTIDYERDSVTSLTSEGNVKAVYKDEELVRPSKVCTDHRGNVYVCGCISRNVHVLTAECVKIRVIWAHGLHSVLLFDSFVRSVGHCQDTNRLFVGMKKSNMVSVYQRS